MFAKTLEVRQLWILWGGGHVRNILSFGVNVENPLRPAPVLELETKPRQVVCAVAVIGGKCLRPSGQIYHLKPLALQLRSVIEIPAANVL